MNIERMRPAVDVRLVFPSSLYPANFVRRLTLILTIQCIHTALNAAIKATAIYNNGKEFSRKSALTCKTIVRLLVGAEWDF